MNTNQRLRKKLNRCFSEWEGQFDIDIEHTHMDTLYTYFSVVIRHYILGTVYEFDARASKSQELKISCNGDHWRTIDKATLFAWMWFKTAQPRTQEDDP